MKSDKKNRSLEELNSMIEKDSSNPNNYFNRAIYYLGNSKEDKDTLEKALKDINKAIEIDNQNDRYFFIKGLIIYFLWENKRILDQQTETMLPKNFDMAIELNPNDADYYYWRGIAKNVMCLPYSDTDPSAVDDFEKAVQIDPKTRMFWIRLGDSCRSLGRDNRAIEAYTKAIEIEPSTSLLSKRGHLYYLLEEYDKAIRDFSIILKEKKTADHLYYRAKSYLKADMIDDALEDFSDSLQLYDNSTSEFSGNEKVYCIWNIYVFMSFIYLIKKEPDLHKKYLQLFIESAPKISYNQYYIEVLFLTNPEHEGFSSKYVEDSIEALWMSCRLASIEQFCNIWKILCGNSDLGPLLPWESEDEIIKYMEDPQNESTASTDFLERINSILKIKFPQIKSNHSPSMIFSNLLNTYGEKGQELYFLIIKSLILEYFFADSIIPWQSVSDGEEVHDDAKTPLRKLKNKKEDRNILVFRNKIYLGILTKLNERIFQITEDKRRQEENIKREIQIRHKEEILQARLDERNKVIADLSHSLKNIVATVADPLENLRQTKEYVDITIEKALRGANLVREITNAMNYSLKGSVDDFYHDAEHNQGHDAQTLTRMVNASLRNSASNMFDTKYFSTFSKNYFPDRDSFFLSKNDWTNLGADAETARIANFIEKYLTKIEIELNEVGNLAIGNDKGSAVKLLTIIQEMILNAIKYSSFVEPSARTVRIKISGEANYLTISVENKFKPQVKAKTTGMGLVILRNFAEMLKTTLEIDTANEIYSAKFKIPNFWRGNTT